MASLHRNGDSEQDDSPSAKRSPQFLSGSRQMSLAALREKIEDQLIAETSPAILRAAADESARRDLIREAADYVLSVEGVTLSRADRLAIQDVIYSDLFRLGPLDGYIQDNTITEITIDRADRVHVRYGAGEMVAVDVFFDDAAHVERVIQWTLATAGAQVSDSDPFIEVGTVLAGRPARVTAAAPPVSPMLHVEIRLHPTPVATLDALVSSGMLDQSAQALLTAILRAGHGLMIVGDAGSGKTTLLEALLTQLPTGSVSVERAAELRLPPGIERLAAIPPAPGQSPVSFADQIVAALAHNPASWLVLDEVRFDESEAMWQALTSAPGTRCLWAFRGTTNPLRLRTAFSMAVRRAVQTIDQAVINSALLDRLPFVALLARQNQQIKVISINEWQRDNQQPDMLALRPIWPAGGYTPVHPVDWLLT
ncbi:MAG: Flp pilus assembly complex ATPase component TadA [Anaerolineae bacterium]|nr:Flp pilus assembly complex ATPase component TadA [Anaerolineae bacterium]